MFRIEIETDQYDKLIAFGRALAAMEIKPTEPKEKKQAEPKPRVLIDVGKIHALRKAGWSVKGIADEMRISQATVYAKLNQPYKGGQEQ